MQKSHVIISPCNSWFALMSYQNSEAFKKNTDFDSNMFMDYTSGPNCDAQENFVQEL